MYVNTTTRETVDLPALRRAFPHMSFPADGPDDATLAAIGHARRTDVAPPTVAENQTVAEGPPELADGVWRQTWVVSEMSAEAYAEKVQAARDAAVSRLQSDKWTRMTEKMAYDGHSYDIDRDSRDLLTGKVATLAMGKTLPSGFVWKTSDKDESGQPIYAPHTADSLKALAFAIDDYTQAIFTASETAQSVVRTATTIADVATAEAAVSWPTT